MVFQGCFPRCTFDESYELCDQLLPPVLFPIIPVSFRALPFVKRKRYVPKLCTGGYMPELPPLLRFARFARGLGTTPYVTARTRETLGRFRGCAGRCGCNEFQDALQKRENIPLFEEGTDNILIARRRQRCHVHVGFRCLLGTRRSWGPRLRFIVDEDRIG
jgi:hypothetical protein